MANQFPRILSLRRSFPRLFRVPTRTFSLTLQPLKSDPFQTRPSPPRLPKEDQELFEQLQRQSTGAFSTPRSAPKANQPGESSASSSEARISEGEELHPDIRHGVKPEFEGDVNPKTGEVGGPKNEPLRWGAEGDWSYSGRVTDF